MPNMESDGLNRCRYSAGGPGFNTQSRTASYQRRYKNGTSSFLVWHSTIMREILALSEDRTKMLWIKSGIENPSKSEVIGRCGGDKKNDQNDQTEPTKDEREKLFCFNCTCGVLMIHNNSSTLYTPYQSRIHI